MGLEKAINMINIHKITLKFKSKYYRHYTYIWKEKKNATIINLYHNLNLMQHFTCVTLNESLLK